MVLPILFRGGELRRRHARGGAAPVAGDADAGEADVRSDDTARRRNGWRGDAGSSAQRRGDSPRSSARISSSGARRCALTSFSRPSSRCRRGSGLRRRSSSVASRMLKKRVRSSSRELRRLVRRGAGVRREARRRDRNPRRKRARRAGCGNGESLRGRSAGDFARRR